MAFFTRKRDTQVKDDGYGRVYVMKFILDDGTIIHKIGMCHSDRTTDRMMEVLRSFFIKYRYVPRSSIRKNVKTLVPYLLEKHMHELLDKWKYRFDKDIDGNTEMFHNLDEEVVLDYLDNFDYKELLCGKTTMDTDDYDNIRLMIKEKEVKKTKNSDILQF